MQMNKFTNQVEVQQLLPSPIWNPTQIQNKLAYSREEKLKEKEREFAGVHIRVIHPMSEVKPVIYSQRFVHSLHKQPGSRAAGATPGN